MAGGIRRLTGGKRKQPRPDSGPAALRELLDDLPDDLLAQSLTHSSWVDHRADSYGRLAFLGDSVLGLAIADNLFHTLPRSDIGRLTKVHGQAVSGRACAEVADDLGLIDRLKDAAPARAVDGGIDVTSLLASERALASICEAVIGACCLHHGYETTAAATVAAFADELTLASDTLLDFKSALQERLARDGTRVRYEISDESGPAHNRRFEVTATVEGEAIGKGEGRSKKAAEQAAAAQGLERLRK
ncbi:ribonuclease III [soil metagenome]